MRALNKEVALELRDGVDHRHGHAAGGTGEIDAANPKTREGVSLPSLYMIIFFIKNRGVDYSSIAPP